MEQPIVPSESLLASIEESRKLRDLFLLGICEEARGRTTLGVDYRNVGAKLGLDLRTGSRGLRMKLPPD